MVRRARSRSEWNRLFPRKPWYFLLAPKTYEFAGPLSVMLTLNRESKLGEREAMATPSHIQLGGRER